MAIHIEHVRSLPVGDLAAFIDGGYSSPAKYLVRRNDEPHRIVITAELTTLNQPYVKRWEHGDADELRQYQTYLKEDCSLGAYDGEALVGVALSESRRWNRTLWLWEFFIVPTHRRRGIGRALMEEVAIRAASGGFRAIGLETQNTNVPAISFYRSVGFRVEGIDLSFYTNHDVPDGEVAFFMRRPLA